MRIHFVCGRHVAQTAFKAVANSGCVSLESAALNELVAQLVEQRPFKAWVLGSIPSELTTPWPRIS